METESKAHGGCISDKQHFFSVTYYRKKSNFYVADERFPFLHLKIAMLRALSHIKQLEFNDIVKQVVLLFTYLFCRHLLHHSFQL